MLFFHILNLIGIILMMVSIFTSITLFCLAGVIIILLSTNSVIHKKIGSNDVFSPLFVSTTIFIISCSIGAILFYSTSAYPEDILIYALVYTMIFIISFILGFSSNIGNVLTNGLPRLKSDFSIKRLRFATVLFLPTGVLLYVFLMYKAGLRNPLEVLKNLMLFRQFYGQQGWAYVMEFSFFLIQAPFWGWMLKRDNLIKINLFMVIYFVLIIFFALLTGTRGAVFSLFLGILFVYHCKCKKITISKALLLTAVLIIPASVFHVIQGSFRGGGVEIGQIIQLAQDLNFSEAILAFTGRFTGAFRGFVDILLNFHRLDLIWGKSFYNALFLPIPRALIPDKPFSFNIQMTRQFYPGVQFFGEEYGIIAELFMNFHLAGLIIGGFVFGIMIKIMQKYYIANQTNISFLFLYRSLVFLPVAWVLGGLINSEASTSLFLNFFFAFVFFSFVWPRKGIG